MCRIALHLVRSAVPLKLITAPDERQRCCAVHNGERCPRPTAWRFAPPGTDEHEQELYTYSCNECARAVQRLLGADVVATFVR